MNALLNHVPVDDGGAAIDAKLGPVHRIAVFRALVLGDMICATPALRALKQRFSQARLTLIGLPWAREWASRQSCVDDFIAFPGHAQLPESSLDEAEWPGFLAQIRSRHFDLAVQLHGSGGVTNELLREWKARHLVAFHEAGQPAPEPGLGTPWPSQGTEAERLMCLVDQLGACGQASRDDRLKLEFPLTAADTRAAKALLARHGLGFDNGQPVYVCIHPGSQLPSRRWPAARFARVADALADSLSASSTMARAPLIVITGTAKEAPIAAALRQAMRHPAIDLTGDNTTLWELGALIRDAALIVCNDTGVSHIAAAWGTPSVVVSCGGDALRWAPRDKRLHATLWSARPCRPCMHTTCPYGHECALDISAEEVIAQARTLLARHSSLLACTPDTA